MLNLWKIASEYWILFVTYVVVFVELLSESLVFLFLCPDAWARLQCVKAASIACINVWTNVVCICHVHSLDWDETSVRSDNFFHVPIVHFNSSVIRKLMLNIILIWSSSMHPSLSNVIGPSSTLNLIVDGIDKMILSSWYLL